ncbi:MAG: putative molybdenum carrier protein, partial [Candidatus Thioglobus sp.]
LKKTLDIASESLDSAVERTDSGIPKATVKKFLSQIEVYTSILNNTDASGGHSVSQRNALSNLKVAINNMRKRHKDIDKEARALKQTLSETTPKPTVKKTKAVESPGTIAKRYVDAAKKLEKVYITAKDTWSEFTNTLTDINDPASAIHYAQKVIPARITYLESKIAYEEHIRDREGTTTNGKKVRQITINEYKTEIKNLQVEAKETLGTSNTQESEQDTLISTISEVVNSYNTRFKNSKRKIRAKFDRTIKSLAAANPGQVLIKLNPEAIADDYEAGMVHIDGKSKGKFSDTSIQKKEVFKQYNIDVKAFKKYIEENGGLETYVKFIIEHELQHFRQRALAKKGEGKTYPKDLMHPDALELEHDANLAGFKAIGFVQYTKVVKEEKETTKLEQQLAVARDKFAATMKEIEATIKDFKNNPAYIKAKKKFDAAVADLKTLKQLGIEGFKAERARKYDNSILQKIKDKVFPIATTSNTTYTVTDIFKVKDINRTSFFSENTDEVLTAKSIAKKLKALGITDTAYIRVIAKNFILFKDNFNKNVLPEDVVKAYLSKGVFINNQTHNAFYVKDDSELGFHMPDEILFAMMLTTLQWTAINVNKAQIKPGFAIAKWALGDPKRVGDLSTKQYQVFRNQGIQLREAANDIGSEIMDLLNMHADTESKESLQMHMDLMKYEAYASENMLLKDSTFNNKAGNSLALLALETARHMYIPKNKGKDIESGLVEIAKAIYDKDLFDTSVYTGFKNVGKHKKALENNTVLIPKVEDNVEVAGVLEVIRENVEGFELIKGAESSLKDISSQPIKTVKDRVNNTFFDIPAKAKKLVQAVHNVAWEGKKPELSLVAILNDDTLENVVNIKDPSIEHITEREGIEAANEDKLQDIQYVKDYLLSGTNKLKQFFLRYALQKQNRLGIDVNTLNPQRSKIIRGLIFPKDKDTVIGAKGSSNKAELDRAVFMVAVAQAFGYGIDKKVLGNVFKEFDKIYADPTVTKLITAINKKTQNKKLINKLMNEVLALEFVTPSMHVVEGVVALASYSATESFNTTLGMETDGVTNGYAISIMQFLGVDPEILKRKYTSPKERKLAIANDLIPRFERIGVFIGKETDDYGTFEKFIASGKDDIYQALTRRLRITLAGTLSTQTLVATSLKLLHGDLVEKDLITLTKFARDLAKNPLMISNYGAGIARVIKDITAGFIPGIYKKLSEIQTDYNTAKNKAERDAVLVRLQEFEEALEGFNNVTLGDNLIEMIKSKEVDAEGNPTNLYSIEFDKDNTLKLEKKFKDLHAKPIEDALTELIGPVKEAREIIIEAVENSFFAFMLKFDEATNVKPALTSGAKELIANELAAKYMPAMSGPWSKGENLIQLIKTVQESNSNKIQVVTKPIQIHTYKKESKLWGDPIDTNKTTTLQISDTSYEFVSPGTSVGTNMVQNLESVVLGEMLFANIDQMPIFDAKISSVGDTFETTAEYNKHFKDINLEHSFLKEALIQFDRINNNLTEEERKTVDTAMKTKSFRADSIAKRLSKATEPHEITELKKQAKTLGTAHARARLVAKIAEVEEQHAALEEIHGTLGKRGSWITRVSQMFIHETLEKIASGEMVIEDVKNIKFIKAKQEKATTRFKSVQRFKTSEIKFEEDTNNGYAPRTRINASADATIAIAVDFTSAGERLTKRVVKEQNNTYIGLNVSKSLDLPKQRINNIVKSLNKHNVSTLNIAGNGIYTMKGQYTQEQVDTFTFELLKAVTTHPDLKLPITSVRTGGQTGFDEAGAKASQRLGIPTTILAPKGWKFRTLAGIDVSNKDTFMARFLDIFEKTTWDITDTLKNPDTIFIFGDNLLKRGKKGQ